MVVVRAARTVRRKDGAEIRRADSIEPKLARVVVSVRQPCS
jgi:ribosomal protein L14